MTERTWSGWLARILEEADARQLPALVAEWASAADERPWIARALRIDLALLTLRPELAVPCLVRRVARIGTEHEAAFYARRPAVPEALAAASRVVQHWSETWNAPRPWLRALRPPALPIDSGVVEEYRTDQRGPLALDDAYVEVGGALAWDRGTGRVVPRSLAPRPCPPVEWELAPTTASRWGTLLLVERSTGRERLVRHDQGEIVRRVQPLGDGLVLATGAELDAGAFHCVVDPGAAAILWRGRGACSALEARGDRVAMVVDDRFELRLARSGARLASWYCGPASELAVAESGTVATRDGAVIRVWDAAIADAWDAFAPLTTDTWIDAAFSPDGTRLVTSSLLCDARSGDPIAALPINGPGGWVEGGPPRGCQRLLDHVVAEVMPWGISVWSSDDGTLRLDRVTPGASARDHVAFAPNGQSIAMYQTRQRRLQVFDIAQGRIILDAPWDLDDVRLEFDRYGSALLVESGHERWVVQGLGPFSELRIERSRALPWAAPPRTLDVRDGVLEHISSAALPCDDAVVAVSPDGMQFATRRAHYALESAASIVVSLDD